MDFTEKARQERIKNTLPILQKGWKILDCACGDGWMTEYLTNLGFDIVGIDLNPKKEINTKKMLKRKGKFKKADARNLPFKDDTFDAVISFHTLEHVLAEYEFKRVLKKGGLLILDVPSADFPLKILDKFGLIQEGVDDHIRIVNFNKLPFYKMYWKPSGYGLCKFGVFRNVIH